MKNFVYIFAVSFIFFSCVKFDDSTAGSRLDCTKQSCPIGYKCVEKNCVFVSKEYRDINTSTITTKKDGGISYPLDDTDIQHADEYGTLGNHCYGNHTCNEDLVCNKNNICVPDKKISEGNEWGNCYGNHTCNEGLFCDDDNLCKKNPAITDDDDIIDYQDKVNEYNDDNDTDTLCVDPLEQDFDVNVTCTSSTGTPGTYQCDNTLTHTVCIPDGTLKWKFQTNDGISSSPAIASDGTIYVGSSGYLYAIQSDGTLKWKFQTNDGISSSPAIASDGTIYVGSWDKYLYAIKSDGNGYQTASPWPKFHHDNKNTGRAP